MPLLDLQIYMTGTFYMAASTSTYEQTGQDRVECRC